MPGRREVGRNETVDLPLGRVSGLWSPFGFSMDGEAGVVHVLASQIARSSGHEVYLIIEPAGAGSDPWEEPVLRVAPDGSVEMTSRDEMVRRGLIVPEPALDGRCGEILGTGRRCGAATAARAGRRGWCGPHLPRWVTCEEQGVRVDDAEGFFAHAFDLLEPATGCTVQLLLVDGFGAMRFSDGLVVDWMACPQQQFSRSHYLADATCRCPATAK